MHLLLLISNPGIWLYVLALATDTCKNSISFSLSEQAAKPQQFPPLYDTLHERTDSLIIK